MGKFFCTQNWRKINEIERRCNTIVFLGSSGVGKSTLVDTFASEELMKVSEIRENDSKGRHTTTHRQLFMLSSGVAIIDTPGIRELGMWEASEGIDDTFSDIRSFLETASIVIVPIQQNLAVL